MSLEHTGYLEANDYAVCGRCYQPGIPPYRVSVHYAGKAEDKITGLVRHNFILLEPVYCLKCGARIFDIFTDAEFRPIEEIA